MMDPQSRTTLDEILAKEPAALTDGDKEFLRARRSYLNEEQQAVFAEVLAEGQDEAAEGSTEVPAEKTTKAKKTDEVAE